MARSRTVLLAAICLVLLCSCRQEVAEVLRSRQSWNLRIYETGRVIEASVITAGTPKYQAVLGWMESKEDGWNPSFVSYVPGIELSGQNFSVSISPKTLVLVVESKEYTRSLSDQDYVRIREILDVRPHLGPPHQ